MKDDTISRRAAINAIGERPMVWNGSDYELGARNQYDADLLAIETVSPAQPERKRGKWVYAEDEYGIDGYHCNQCGFFVPWDYAHKFINYIEEYHYCPNCGKRMIVKE